MGITIFYRGRMADPERIDELEDRVLDLALELGGMARMWRSWPNDQPNRVVRGLIVNLFPGQETLSLLISPEGWLVPLHEIQLAEEEPYKEPPQCWIKTQFGTFEGHVAIVELLDYLKREFFPDLSVYDEGGYWEIRDIKRLRDKFKQLQNIIDQLKDQFRTHGLTSEAAEDPAILIHRIERVAQRVTQTLARPSAHPTVAFNTEDGVTDDDLEVKKWEALFREQRRQQERMQRVMDVEMREGKRPSEALDTAIRIEKLSDWQDQVAGNETGFDMSNDSSHDDFHETCPDDAEPSYTEHDSPAYEEQASLEFQETSPHPLLRSVSDFTLQVQSLLERFACDPIHLAGILQEAIGELLGGLVQGLRCSENDQRTLTNGWSVVQLKRALRGTAFGRGSAFALRGSDLIHQAEFEFLIEQFDRFQREILELLQTLRPAE